MEADDIKVNYSRKIRIYPNNVQKTLFSKCFGTSRFIYNKGVSYINSLYKSKKETYDNKATCIYCDTKTPNYLCDKHKNKKIKWDLPLTLPKLRPCIMKSDKNLDNSELWQKEVPYDTRQLILKDLIGNYKSCITNKKLGNITKFNVGFKSKKSNNQIFFVTKKAIKNELSIFVRRLKHNSKLKVRKRHSCYKTYIPKHDFMILKEYNRYYIIYPKTRTTSFKKAKYNSVSLDPGVRTFQTYYSPNGIYGKIGTNIQSKINIKTSLIDKLKSLMSKLKPKNRTSRNMKKRCSLLRTKIKNIVRDLHWQACAFLTKHFQNIIIPKFESKQMTNKKHRKIGKKTVKTMLSLSHFSFLEKLKFKCKEYQRNLHIVSEEYTSKTCGNCGVINNNLGSAKIFNCGSCNIKIDRDVNGARNILIKYLGLDPTL